MTQASLTLRNKPGECRAFRNNMGQERYLSAMSATSTVDLLLHASTILPGSYLIWGPAPREWGCL